MTTGYDGETPAGPLLQQKEDGVAVLVTGAVPDAVHRAMSARLLGSPAEDRRRVLALTSHDETDVTDRLPSGARTSPDRLRAVLGDGWTRSAAATPTPTAATAADAPTPEPDVGAGTDVPEQALSVLTDPSLSSFGERLARDVAALDTHAGGFAPGQLRLCVDSLDHLADEYEADQVLRFAHLLADQVRTNDGMAHFHTHHPYDDLPTPGLDAVTEVVVRLRLSDDGPEFRPYLDGDPLTDWASIPPVPE